MSGGEPATSVGKKNAETEVGSVFVSNYPAYSFWTADAVEASRQALDRKPSAGNPLGLYLHIPFCRKRCKFCYFRVYTDKNAADVERYLNALAAELEDAASRSAIAGRPVRFVYFGGGTPSFISARHLRALVDRLEAVIPWDGVEEVTFEGEPGTLTEAKVAAIREVGVTRLSLGVENLNDEILRENGRAHVSKEVYRCLPWIRDQGFDQLNVDLIAGMVGESWKSWRDTVRKTLEIEPDSLTVYQMELPYNTVYSKGVLEGGSMPVADWATKRAWHDWAFEQFEQAGYELSSAYTVVKPGGRFVYRNSVWQGCDLLGLGVSAFGHVNGVHYQNGAGWRGYLEAIEGGRLAHSRAFTPSDEERFTREWILQMKLGRTPTSGFKEKFGIDPLERFAEPLERLAGEGMLEVGSDEVRLTRAGLLQADLLLPSFYDPKYTNARYT